MARRMSEAERQRQIRVTDLRMKIGKFIEDTEEQEIDIWIAAMTHWLSRLSAWRLQDDDKPTPTQ